MYLGVNLLYTVPRTHKKLSLWLKSFSMCYVYKHCLSLILHSLFLEILNTYMFCHSLQMLKRRGWVSIEAHVELDFTPSWQEGGSAHFIHTTASSCLHRYYWMRRLLTSLTLGLHMQPLHRGPGKEWPKVWILFCCCYLGKAGCRFLQEPLFYYHL